MATKPLPSPEVLRQLLRYEPETGRLFWKERPVSMFPGTITRTPEHSCKQWNSRYAGSLALYSINSDGYRAGAIFGIKVRAHRVVWAVTHGEWPGGDIDHINGDRSDNRITNLRDVPRMMNSQNCRMSSNNTSGVNGVHFSTSKQRWVAQVGVGMGRKHLGTFLTMGEAVLARQTADDSYGFHQHHGKRRAKTYASN